MSTLDAIDDKIAALGGGSEAELTWWLLSDRLDGTT